MQTVYKTENISRYLPYDASSLKIEPVEIWKETGMSIWIKGHANRDSKETQWSVYHPTKEAARGYLVRHILQHKARLEDQLCKANEFLEQL